MKHCYNTEESLISLTMRFINCTSPNIPVLQLSFIANSLVIFISNLPTLAHLAILDPTLTVIK